MSSPRVQKIFQGFTNSLRLLGPYPQAFLTGIKWQGRDGSTVPRDAVLIDLTAQAWATGNMRVIVAANPAQDSNNTLALKTQSHASGQFLDGSVSFDVYMETPSAMTAAVPAFAFFMNMMHVVRGQLGAPINLWFTANGTEPTLIGVNGAVATATFASAGTFQPYFFALAGGV